MKKPNPVQEKSFAFAVRIVKLCRILSEKHKEFVLSKQLLKSGTSIGANVRESQNAESNSDFIHKLSISQKETREVIYWLELLKEARYITVREFDSMVQDATEIYKILTSIILSSKKKN